MKIFSVCLALLIGLAKAYGAFNEPLAIKKVSEDGSQFVFVRREGDAPWNGITVKDPHTKSILYEVKVLKCSPSACVGSIVKDHSGLKIRMDEEYIHSYNDKPGIYDTKDAAKLEPETPVPVARPEPIIPVPVPVAPTPPPTPPAPAPPPAPVIIKERPEAKPRPVATKKAQPPPKEIPEVKAPSALDRAVYIAFGTPMGGGFKLGYFSQTSFGWAGGNYGNFSGTTNQVNLKGSLLSATATYSLLHPTPATELSLLGEAGLVKATLDFTGVDPDAPVADETTYFWALGGEGKLNLQQFSFALKMGISKAGFAPVYKGTYSEFNNPYAAILVFLEIGVYYRF